MPAHSATLNRDKGQSEGMLWCLEETRGSGFSESLFFGRLQRTGGSRWQCCEEPGSAAALLDRKSVV